jgi:hypothetical protein
MLRLPECNARNFVVASALGRFLDREGTSKSIRTGKDASGTLIDKGRLPIVLEALGIGERRWRQLRDDWVERYLAHKCGGARSERVFLFARPMPSECAACGSEIEYDHIPPKPRSDRGPGFGANGSDASEGEANANGSTTSGPTEVVLPANGTITSGGVALSLPPTRTNATHHEDGIYGMEVGVPTPTPERSEEPREEAFEGDCENRAAHCAACKHAQDLHFISQASGTRRLCRIVGCSCKRFRAERSRKAVTADA